MDDLYNEYCARTFYHIMIRGEYFKLKDWQYYTDILMRAGLVEYVTLYDGVHRLTAKGIEIQGVLDFKCASSVSSFVKRLADYIESNTVCVYWDVE